MTMRWVMLMGMIACGVTSVPALADKPKSPRTPVIVDGPSETLREGWTTLQTISPSGRWIVANIDPRSSETTNNCLIDTTGKVPLVTISRSIQEPNNVVFSNDEKQLLFRHRIGKEWAIWNIETQQIEATLEKHPKELHVILNVTFSHDSRSVIASLMCPEPGWVPQNPWSGFHLTEFGLDGKFVRDFGERTLLPKRIGTSGQLCGCDSHGCIFAVPFEFDALGICDKSGSVVARIPGFTSRRGLALSPNEKLLAITANHPTLASELQLFNLEPLRQTKSSKDAEPITLTSVAKTRVGSKGVRFHPTGRAIAVDNAKNGVDLHGLDVRRVLVQFRFDKPRKVEAFGFTPDGNSLITVDKSAICRWEVPDLPELE